MGTVTNLADHRESKEGARSVRAPEMTRSVELAFALAIIGSLPKRTRQKALWTVAVMGERCPDCETSVAAAKIAKALL